MKYLYLLLCAIVPTSIVFAQTNPAAQTIPYSQNFDTLNASSTTYPLGWQGWQIGTSTTGAFRLTPPTADRALVASSTASINSGNVHNYAGKIGFLTTGSLDAALALSLNTTGKTSIQVAYDAMTIRNPYDGTTNTRINEMVLQYSVGTGNNFITLTGTEYQNNTTAQTSAVTTPQNTQAKTIQLPVGCNNQPVVQLRWVNRDVSGGGARASFAVDNIAVTSNVAAGNSVSIGPGVDAAEPNTNGNFTVTLSSPAPAGGATITYSLSGTATINSDYSDALNGSLTIPQGSTTAPIAIAVINDAVTEPTETIVATITNITSPYTISTASATINLLDDGDLSPISYTGVTYSQDFNSLASTGTSTVLPAGWLLAETGTNANTSYAVDNGATTSGNTYSYGTGTATDRSFGGLRSGSLVPVLGSLFVNNTGATLSTIVVSYTGEQWRVGALNRADRLDFQYSTNATNLVNGTWTNVDALDFTGPVTSPVGAVDGNLASSRTIITFTITGLAIPTGSTFQFRWTDFDASGSDDGLSIDDFSLSAGCTPPTNQPTNLSFVPAIQQMQGSFTNATATAGTVAPDRYLIIISNSPTLSEQPSSGMAYAGDDVIGGGRVVAITDGTNNNNFTVTDLSPGTIYYFFIYSFTNSSGCYNITNPLVGSQATTTPPPCTPPTVQASNLSATATANAINLVYTRGNGSNVLILAHTGSAVNAEPINSVNYTVGSVIGTGNTVIYNGPASNFNYAGLAQNTTYHFALFEYASTGNCYLKPASVGNFSTSCATPIDVSAFVATAGNAQSTLNWATPTASCFDEVVVVISTSSITGPGQSYSGTANPFYIGAGAPQVVYRGVGSTVSVTGLINGTLYYVKAFTRLGSVYSNGVQVTIIPYDPATGFTYLFGNLHAHSSYSDGNKDNTSNTPDEDFAFARDALCMDYLGISEHNHSQAGMSYPDYLQGYNEANSLNLVTSPAGNSIVTLWGMEWGVISGGGHVLVYGFDDKLLGWEAGNYDIFVPKNDYSALWAAVNNKAGAIATLAHPNSGDFGNLASTYNGTADNAIVGVAVASGPAFSTSTSYNDPPSRLAYLSYFRNLLSKGYHLAPQMDQDNHNLTFGTANANRTVVLAATKTRESILEALRSSRYYASEDCNLKIEFKQGNNPMGSSVVKSGLPTLTLDATDVNGETVSTIELWAGQAGNNVVPSSPIKTYVDVASFSFGISDIENTQPASTTYYYYAVVTQADGDKAVTAPIWYTRNEVILPVTFVSFNLAYDKTTKAAMLLWSTAQEFNSKEFVVERSVDGIHFTSIGKVPAALNSQVFQQYRFNDDQPLQGVSYYRIRQVDVDSKATFSSIQKLDIDENKAVQYAVYPNPTNAFTYVRSNTLAPEKVTIKLLDNLGKLVSSITGILGPSMPVKVDLSACQPGTYLIQIIGKETTSSSKVILFR